MTTPERVRLFVALELPSRVRSALDLCREASDLSKFSQELRNPFFIGEHVGLTQTSGWLDGWTCAASAYAVAARTTAHVVAAVWPHGHDPSRLERPPKSIL